MVQTLKAGRLKAGSRRYGALVAVALFLSACGHSPTTTASSPSNTPGSPTASAPPTPTSGSPLPSQKPVPAESNPPGDIPDTTAYVTLRSPRGHFAVKVPEGWARTTRPSMVSFSSALNSITATWAAASSAPTVASAKRVDVPSLNSSQLAFRLQSVKQVHLSGGTAIEIMYEANSKRNPVTGKQYRLVVERFEFFKNGQEDILSLSSPVGADNVDPWRTVSESFRWA